MKNYLFLTCISLEFLTVLALIYSHLFQHNRIWPPLQQKSWRQYLMLFLFVSTSTCIIFLGLVDWSNYTFSNWIRFIGFTGWVFGNFLSVWAVVALGLNSTIGNAGVLIKLGPYRFSRNPQYAGFIFALLGWGLMTNSILTLIVSILACVPLLLVPLVEEPWLLTKFGKDYKEYIQTVPRYLFWNY